VPGDENYWLRHLAKSAPSAAQSAMPEFVFTPEQIGALTGYLNSLKVWN
jgi:hypothetical protein